MIYNSTLNTKTNRFDVELWKMVTSIVLKNKNLAHYDLT